MQLSQVFGVGGSKGDISIKSNPRLRLAAIRLSWWCSGSASDSWSQGRWFDFQPGLYQVNYMPTQPFDPSGVGKSSTNLHGWG